MTQSPELPCCCGGAHAFDYLGTYSRLVTLIERLGPTIRLQSPDGTWAVPRIYIAAHGIRGRDLPRLATKYGWQRL